MENLTPNPILFASFIQRRIQSNSSLFFPLIANQEVQNGFHYLFQFADETPLGQAHKPIEPVAQVLPSPLGFENKSSSLTEKDNSSLDLALSAWVSHDQGVFIFSVPKITCGEDLWQFSQSMLEIERFAEERELPQIWVEISADNRKALQVLYQNQFEIYQQDLDPKTQQSIYLFVKKVFPS